MHEKVSKTKYSDETELSPQVKSNGIHHVNGKITKNGIANGYKESPVSPAVLMNGKNSHKLPMNLIKVS